MNLHLYKKQLDQINTEMHQTKEDFKSLMKKEELKTFITNTIQNMTKTLHSKLEESLGKKKDETIDAELEEKRKKK